MDWRLAVLVGGKGRDRLAILFSLSVSPDFWSRHYREDGNLYDHLHRNVWRCTFF